MITIIDLLLLFFFVLYILVSGPYYSPNKSRSSDIILQDEEWPNFIINQEPTDIEQRFDTFLKKLTKSLYQKSDIEKSLLDVPAFGNYLEGVHKLPSFIGSNIPIDFSVQTNFLIKKWFDENWSKEHKFDMDEYFHDWINYMLDIDEHEFPGLSFLNLTFNIFNNFTTFMDIYKKSFPIAQRFDELSHWSESLDSVLQTPMNGNISWVPTNDRVLQDCTFGKDIQEVH